MADMTDVKIRLNFWRSAYEKLTAAYTALVDGRVKSYTIDDRQLTRFDLGTLKDEIEEAEQKIDELTALLNGRRPRKAVGVIPATGDLFREVTKMIPGKAPERAFCTGSLAEFAPFAAGGLFLFRKRRR